MIPSHFRSVKNEATVKIAWIKTELYLASRYLSIKKKSFFNMLTIAISVGGVALGVASLIVTLAIMSGFQGEIREKILGYNPHIIMFYPTSGPEIEKLKNVDEISRYYPFVLGQAMAQSRHGTTGVVIKGLDDGTTADLSDDGISLGKEIAKTLGAGVGDEVLLFYSSKYEFGFMPRITKAKVSKFLDSGMFDYDSSMALTKLKKAKEILQLGEKDFTGIGVNLKNADKASAVSRKIIAEIPYAQLRTWKQMNRTLFEALKLEKIMMFIVLALIVIVAAFNIVSNLALFVSQKSKDIGILKSMGVTRWGISRVFVYIGTILGSFGIVLGSFVGIAVSFILKKYDIIKLPADVYFISKLPVRMEIFDISWVIVVSFLITLLATVWPSYKAGKMNSADILRYG